MDTPHRDRPFTGWVTRLARDHTARLVGIARHEGLVATDALDAVQEAFHTFLLLPQGRRLVDEPDEAGALLAVLARNVARNMRRRHHRAREHVEFGDVGLADPAPDVEALVVRAEEHVRLLGCVARLSEVQRQVVSLRMLGEVSGEQAARDLGVTPGHVAVLLHRAKKELERCMVE
jgi:RNA polymerase sigma-70 factor (ECF subfamily)